METFEDYLDSLIKDGFLSKNGSPLKCIYCEGIDLEERNEHYCQYGREEYEVWCSECNKKISHWAYGSWFIE